MESMNSEISKVQLLLEETMNLINDAESIEDASALLVNAKKTPNNRRQPVTLAAIWLIVQKLVDICYAALRFKKKLVDDSYRKNISKAVSQIKMFSPVYSQQIQNQNSSKSFIDKEKAAAKIIQSLNSINSTLKKAYRMQQDSRERFKEDGGIENQQMSENFETLKPQTISHFKNDFNNNSSSYSSTSDVANGREVGFSSTEDVLEKSSKLIEKAHAILSQSHKTSIDIPDSEREKIKVLRRNLNSAILDFDDSSSKLLEASFNIIKKKDVAAKSNHLIEAMSAMRNFLDTADNKKLIKTIIKNVESEDYLTKFRSISSTDRIKGCPITLTSFTEKCKQLDMATSNKDYMSFERTSNSLADFHESLGRYVKGFKKCSSQCSDIEEAYNTALKTTRVLLHRTRNVFSEKKEQPHQIMKMIYKDWSLSQFNLVKQLWIRMKPWSSILGSLFERRNSRTFSNRLKEEVNAFKCISIMLDCLAIKFENIDMDHKMSCGNFSIQLKECTEKIMQLAKLYLMDEIVPNEWITFSIWFFKWFSIVKKLFHQIDTYTLLEIRNEDEFNKFYERWVKIIKRILSRGKQMAGSCMIHNTGLKWIKCGSIIFYIASLVHNVPKCMSDVTSEEREELKKLSEELNEKSSDMKKLDTTIDCQQAQFLIMLQEWKLLTGSISLLISNSSSGISKPISSLICSSMGSEKCKREDNFSRSFAEYLVIFEKKMERVRIHACLAIDRATCRKHAHKAMESLDELDTISNDVMVILKNSKESNSLKSLLYVMELEWISAASSLVNVLRSVPDVRYSAISAIMRHFYTENDVSTPYEFLDVISEKDRVLYFSSYTDINSLPSWLDDNTLPSEYDSVYSSWAATSNSVEYKYADSNDISPRGIDLPILEINRSQIADESDALVDSLCKFQAPSIPRLLLSTTDSETSQDLKFTSYGANNIDGFDKKERITQSNNKKLDQLDGGGLFANKDVESMKFDEPYQPSPKTISAAAHILHHEANQWEEENNAIVKIVKLMAKQMLQMAQFAEGRGELKSKDELVLTAKAIAANARTVSTFATIIAEHSEDQSCKEDLLHYAELVPTISTQLRIVASVKSITVNDETANTMLITNASNLMKGVVGTLKAAESASVKIFQDNDSDISDTAVRLSRDLVIQWKRKARMTRAMSALASPKDEQGLRKSTETPLASLADLVLS